MISKRNAKHIEENWEKWIVTIGLNTGVTNHIEESGVYVGTPAKKIK